MLRKILLIAVAIVFNAACKNNDAPEVKTVETDSANLTAYSQDSKAVYAKAEFEIEGMTCAIGCARTIEKNIAKMDGVKFAKVDFDKKLAMVEYDQAKVTPDALEKTVSKTGEVYKVHDMKKVDEFSEK